MIRMHRFIGGIVALLAGLSSGSALAAQQPAHLPHGGLQLYASSASARAVRGVSPVTPAAAGRAWHTFMASASGNWTAMWDDATGVPLRIYGAGLPAPGAVSSAATALKLSEHILASHIDLLAPSASPSDFSLVANELHDGMRVVAFRQHHAGVPVLGGQLSFRFKNDRLVVIASEALPAVHVAIPSTTVKEATARLRARTWIATDLATVATASNVEGPFILPLVSNTSVLGYRPVMRVTVATSTPLSRWAVYVDATSGNPVAREHTLRFADGNVLYNAPVRHPGAERADYPAKHANLTVNGALVLSDGVGKVSFADGSPATVTTKLVSPYVDVRNDSGPEATAEHALDPSGTVTWNMASNETVDAQISAFVHAQLAKELARTLAPSAGWLDKKLLVNVNIDDRCNAFYDGTSLNFFLAGDGCANTGRLADVVYHEFGHAFHHQSVVLGSGAFDAALSEGLSDYYSATLTGDPGMGRGFFNSNEPLRHIDPANKEYVWPRDVGPEEHATGLIIGSTLWDLRKAMIAKHGEVDGVSIADNLFLACARNASDIPSTFVEVLAADDDDGDLDNGTPNLCEIVEVFSLHGLRPISIGASRLSVEPPSQSGFEIAIHVDGLFPECPDDELAGAEVVWALERKAEQESRVEMTGGPNNFSGVIPKQAAGEVVRYRVQLEMANGAPMVFPDNPADRMYQFLVGEVVPIYCTDFETDPELEGWSHQLLSGNADEGADDWQWGRPNGGTNGDPPEAYSGSYVFGNDLGRGDYNGLYQPDKTNVADAPVIDVSDFAHVRVQYRRWLDVEDGYFDRATIYANGDPVWANHASINEDAASVHHRDREWRFHDIDVTDHIGADGTLAVRFELMSDRGLEFGGWSIDDFCIVGYEGSAPTDAICGNGITELGEECDDGNLEPGDGCDASCGSEQDGTATNDDNLLPSGGCACRVAGSRRPHTGWTAALLLAAAAATGAARRRRQRGVR